MSRRKTALAFVLLLLIIPMTLKGYTYKYELESAGFMSYSEMGQGIVCPGLLGAYYSIDSEGRENFIRVYRPSASDLKRLNDPHIIEARILGNPDSRRTELGNGTVAVELAWDDEGKYLTVHHRLVAVYRNGKLVRVSTSLTHSLNYDPRNSSVIVDYVNTYTRYTVKETRCWPLLMGWWGFVLKEYLKHELGDVPRRRAWNEPW